MASTPQIKRYRLAEWIREQSHLYLVQVNFVIVFVCHRRFHKDDYIFFLKFLVISKYVCVSLCIHLNAGAGEGQKALNQSP